MWWLLRTQGSQCSETGVRKLFSCAVWFGNLGISCSHSKKVDNTAASNIEMISSITLYYWLLQKLQFSVSPLRNLRSTCPALVILWQSLRCDYWNWLIILWLSKIQSSLSSILLRHVTLSLSLKVDQAFWNFSIVLKVLFTHYNYVDTIIFCSLKCIISTSKEIRGCLHDKRVSVILIQD